MCSLRSDRRPSALGHGQRVLGGQHGVAEERYSALGWGGAVLTPLGVE